MRMGNKIKDQGNRNQGPFNFIQTRFVVNLWPRTHSVIFIPLIRRVDLEAEIQKNKALEGDVENFQRRQRYQDEIKVLEQKRPWLEYEDKRLEWNAEKEKLKEKVCE